MKPFRNADEARHYEGLLHRETYQGCLDVKVGDTEAYVTKRVEYNAGIRVIRITNGTNLKGKPIHLWLVYNHLPGEIQFLVDAPIEDESRRRMRALYGGYGHHVLTARTSKDAHAAANEIMQQNETDAAERRRIIREMVTRKNYKTTGFSDAEVISALIEGSLVG